MMNVPARDLSVIVSRVSAQRYIVGVANNGLNELPFKIASRLGSIVKIKEITLHDSVNGKHAIGPDTPGYLPVSTDVDLVRLHKQSSPKPDSSESSVRLLVRLLVFSVNTVSVWSLSRTMPVRGANVHAGHIDQPKGRTMPQRKCESAS